jgi:hypothetical protein
MVGAEATNQQEATMASIAASVARIKQDALGALDRSVVEGVCQEFAHAWRDHLLYKSHKLVVDVPRDHDDVLCLDPHA